MNVLLGALGIALYCAVAGFLILNGTQNVDEGFYGLAARAAISGSLPYRDFGYTQTPLFPYVHGAVAELTGFGFIGERLASGVWAFLTFLIGSAWLWRRYGRATGIGFAVILLSTLQWMYFTHLPKTYAFVGLLLLVNIIILEARPRFGERMFWTSLLGVVAVGCRLPMAPFYLVLWAGLLCREYSNRNLVRAIFWPTLFTLLLITPFVAAAPRSFLFWALDFHRESSALKFWRLDLMRVYLFAPALSLMTLAFTCALVGRRIRLDCPLDFILLGIFVTLGCNLLPVGTYEEYASPLIPSLAFVFFVLLGRLRVNSRLLGLFCALCVLINLCALPPVDTALYRDTMRAAAYVGRFQQGDFPFVGSASTVALQAGRPVDPRMVMGTFCCTESYSEKEANKLRLMTPAGIGELMENPGCQVFVLFNTLNWNFVWSMPGFRPVSDAAIGKWKSTLARDFIQEYGDAHYVVYVRRSVYDREKRGMGH
jgi:hypothetical protein